jgi:hypothetical protein
MDSIKNTILELIKDENYDVKDLTTVLDSVNSYISDPNFITNINQIVNILTVDRDGSQTFTMDDIKILSKDPLALMSLVTITVSTICSIPSLKIKYDENLSELLVFELFAYLFLVVLPKEAKIKWSYNDKVQIINIATVIVAQVKSSDTLKQIFSDVISWFKINVKCSCLGKNQPTTKEILNKKLIHHKLIIQNAIDNEREKNSLKRDLNLLKNNKN